MSDSVTPRAGGSSGCEPRGEPLSILHVEDNPVDTQLVAGLLKREGLDWLVERVESMEAFVHALKSRRHALILCDHSVPGFDSLQALQLAREQAPDVPFIFLSGAIGEEAAIETLRLGATDYVLKQRIARLIPAIQRALAQASEEHRRRRAEEALRESEQRFRALVMATADVIYWMSPDWSEMRQLRSHHFIEETDAPTRSWMERYIHPDDRPRVLRAIEDAIRTGSTFHLEHRVIRADGSLGWTLSRAVPLRDASGAITEWFGVATDVTDRKRAEEAVHAANDQLREADRRKNEFLGMLSHELRNPLAPIRNSVYILGRAAPGGQQADRALGVIDRQVEHLTHLVDDLLDVTRIERGKIRLQRESLELQAIARRTLEDHRAQFNQKGVELELQAPAAPVMVSADATRLAQMIGNLLVNAAKFTHRGGRTMVTVEEAGPFGVLTVEDTGEGIAPEMLTRLFEPFVQVENTLARSSGGLGLGLTLVKGLAELQGGTVRAHSEGLGKGSTFTLSLPLERRRAPRLEVVSPEPGTMARHRVLLIEDNIDAAESLKEVLELNGHSVDVAVTGPDGVQAAEALRYDVIICDIGLPGMDGFQVARAIRATPGLNRVPLIALSGYVQPEDLQRSREAGFDRHLAKPPDLDGIERAIAEVRAMASERTG